MIDLAAGVQPVLERAEIVNFAATRNALNALNERQSRDVRGLKKLYANRMKTAELMTTRLHSPFAGVSPVMTISLLD